jgi:hypothetical protein
MTSHNGNGTPGGNKKIILVTGATGNQAPRQRHGCSPPDGGSVP